MFNTEVFNLTSDISQTIARWETMISNKILPKNLSYFIDEIYLTLTKYMSPSIVSNLISVHTKNIGGSKNA